MTSYGSFTSVAPQFQLSNVDIAIRSAGSLVRKWKRDRAGCRNVTICGEPPKSGYLNRRRDANIEQERPRIPTLIRVIAYREGRSMPHPRDCK